MMLLAQQVVAAALGVSTARVRQLDRELQPIHVAGGPRVYSVEHVDAMVGRRMVGVR